MYLLSGSGFNRSLMSGSGYSGSLISGCSHYSQVFYSKLLLIHEVLCPAATDTILILHLLRNGEFKAIVRMRMHTFFSETLELPEEVCCSKAAGDILVGKQALLVQDKLQVLDQLLLTASHVVGKGGSHSGVPSVEPLGLVSGDFAAKSANYILDQSEADSKLAELRNQLRGVCRKVAAEPIRGAVKKLKDLLQDNVATA
jgi:hypothetical protein